MDKSLLSSRLNSNYVPTEEEIIQIREALTGPLEKLDGLNKELEQLRKRFHNLEDQHASLYQYIKDHQILISSSRRLPVEILQEIFVHCLPITHNSVVSIDEPPLVLTLVCQQWRQIAFSTPRLWTSIHLPIPHILSGLYPVEVNDEHCEAAGKALAKVAKEWLTRSGDLPLNISLIDNSRSPDYAGPIPHFTDAIIPFSKRWKNLKLSIFSIRSQDWNKISACEAPLLASLSYTASWSDVNTPFEFFKSPNLRRLRINQFVGNLTVLPVRWSNLTYLSLDAVEELSILNVANLLSLCTSLVTCHLQQIWVETIGPSTRLTPSKIGLPSLHKMIVREASHIISDLLNNFEFPSLHQLEYFYSYSLRDRPMVLPLFERISTTLYSFVTDTLLLSETDFFTCLKLCANLVSLSIQSPYRNDRKSATGFIVDDNLLATLSEPLPDEGGIYLCPRLAEVHFLIDAQFTENGLLSFVKSRTGQVRGIAKLRKVQVSFQRAQVTPIAEALNELINGGLSINVFYQPIQSQPVFNAREGLLSAEESLQDKSNFK